MRPSLWMMKNRMDSYYDRQTMRMSPSLVRARRPYFWRNFGTFLALLALPAGIYGYTFHFLHTDDFGDIPIPPLSDEQVLQLQKEYAEQKKKEKGPRAVRA